MPSPEADTLVSSSHEEDLALGDGGGRRRVVVTRSYALSPWRVAVHAEPFYIDPLHLEERAWITAWRSNTENEAGEREPDDIHCHATLSDGFIAADTGAFLGIYTDGFTPEFELPPGFAVPVDAGTRLVFQPMFNNRHPERRMSRMRLEVDYVTEAEGRALGLRPLQGFAVSVVSPELYWVEPFETDVKERFFRVPVSGRVHAVGAHLHPYGETVELRRESDKEVLFTARMEHGTSLGENRLSTYCSEEGFYLTAGERCRLTVLYVNESGERVDAMGGVFLFYDPEGTP
jgi:hypothetical protein